MFQFDVKSTSEIYGETVKMCYAKIKNILRETKQNSTKTPARTLVAQLIIICLYCDVTNVPMAWLGLTETV